MIASPFFRAILSGRTTASNLLTAYEDFETKTFNGGGADYGWASVGIAYTWVGPLAYEDFETKTLTGGGADFGWSGSGAGSNMSFSLYPTAQGIPTGSTLILSASVTNGFSPLTYLWQFNDVSLVEGGNVTGSNTSNLTVNSASFSDFGNYRLTVMDLAGGQLTGSETRITSSGADWALRVIANNGAAPSNGSIAALETFAQSLNTAGIYNMMISVNVFAPDSITASLTPFIKVSGNDPWINHNFLAGDLTINGLVGDGSSKYLDTGVIPANAMPSTTSGGLTIYSFTGNNLGSVDLGVVDSSYTVNTFDLYVNWSDGNTYFDCYGAAFPGGRIYVSNSAWAGFTSGNRIASNDIRLFKANSGTAFTQIQSGANAADQGLSTYKMFCFAQSTANSPGSYSSKRLSFAAVHKGLTSTQAQSLYNAIQTLRTSFGGGYV